MALDDDAVLTAAVGYLFVAEVGTAAPSAAALKTINLKDPSTWTAVGWDAAGHTHENKLPEWGYSGGEEETKGSWQKRKLRDIAKDDRIDYLTATLLQFDEQSLGLYYGENVSDVPGEFGVSGYPDANERAVFAVVEDGDLRLGFHVWKAGVRRSEKIDMPKNDLAGLPVKFKFLDYQDKPLFKWLNEDLFNVAP